MNITTNVAEIAAQRYINSETDCLIECLSDDSSKATTLCEAELVEVTNKFALGFVDNRVKI